jgi:hypothetical protein
MEFHIFSLSCSLAERVAGVEDSSRGSLSIVSAAVGESEQLNKVTVQVLNLR